MALGTTARPGTRAPVRGPHHRLFRHGGLLLMHLVLISVSGFMLLPFVWMLSTSFKPQTEIFTRPPILISSNMSLEGYRYILNYQQTGGVLNVLKNTVIVSASFTGFSLFFCALGGYGFAKYRFPGRRYLFAFVIATMIVPQAVTMVPTYAMMVRFGWVNTFLPLIMPGLANAFGIFFMRQYISTISSELLDAGRIDGCSEFGLFRRIVFPIVIPGLTSLGLIFFMTSWNSYLYPVIYLKSPELHTLPLMMLQMTGPLGFSLYREQMGVAVISIVPLLIIFLVFQKRFVEGITSGAIKG
ncbi:MAG: carbohydrate ABC transporter permease [Chloroflexota bacterium]